MRTANVNRGRTRVALTGGFGSGKSTVLRMFKSKGAAVFDCDAVVHELLENDRSVREKIRRRFGPGVVGTGGGIDRRALADRVFSVSRDRRALERILHPPVRRRIGRAVAKSARTVSVVDVPLLFETGWNRAFDVVVVVDASRTRRQRRLERRGFSASEFKRRSKAQWPLNRKVGRADFVVDNNGSIAATRRQVAKIWNRITNHET